MVAGEKRVLLIFIQADSGVDGASLLDSATVKRSLLSSLKDSALSNIIRRAQFVIPPLSLMILSSQKVPGVSQTICDLRFEKLPLEQHWDMAGISVQTGAVKPAFDLARALRSRGIKVVLGGPYVTIFPDQCRDHADVLVIGEADDIWREVQEDLFSGTLKAEYRVANFPDLSVERTVGKSALDIKSYFTTNVVQTTRGCPYSCDFCNVHVMNGHRLRHRTIPAVLREVETFLKEDKRIFFFLDDTINADEQYAEQLFRELESFKISWVGQATTALGEQPRLLDAFSRSGCGALLVGIESLDDGSNHAHKKFHNPSNRQVECIKNIRKAGICVYGSFIYGLDEDTLELPAKLEAFIEQTGIDVPGIYTQGALHEDAMTIAFTTLILAELLRAYTARSENVPLFKIGFFSNRYMQWAVLTSLALLMVVLYVPGLQQAFDTKTLPWSMWIYIAPLMLVPSLVVEVRKIALLWRGRLKSG